MSARDAKEKFFLKAERIASLQFGLSVLLPELSLIETTVLSDTVIAPEASIEKFETVIVPLDKPLQQPRHCNLSKISFGFFKISGLFGFAGVLMTVGLGVVPVIVVMGGVTGVAIGGLFSWITGGGEGDDAGTGK